MNAMPQNYYATRAVRSRPWIRDYPELLICFEFTIIVNLEDWKLDMDYGKWSYLFEKTTQVYGHRTRTWKYWLSRHLTTQPPHRQQLRDNTLNTIW